MITAAEEYEQEGVIGAADEWLNGCGEVLGGARAAVGHWLVAVRVAGRSGETILSVERCRSGWEVGGAEYGVAEGQAVRRVWEVAV